MQEQLDKKLRTKVIAILFIILNILIQPLWIYYYKSSNIIGFDWFIIIWASLSFLYAISAYLTGHIFKMIFVKSLGGKQIKSKRNDFVQLFYFIYALVVFMILEPSSILFIIVPVLLMMCIVLDETTIILYKHNIICGYQIVNIEDLENYQVAYSYMNKKKQQRILLNFKNKKGKQIEQLKVNIAILAEYLDEQGVEKVEK